MNSSFKAGFFQPRRETFEWRVSWQHVLFAGPWKLRDHHGDWHQAWLCSKEQGGHQSHQWQGGVFSKKMRDPARIFGCNQCWNVVALLVKSPLWVVWLISPFDFEPQVLVGLGTAHYDWKMISSNARHFEVRTGSSLGPREPGNGWGPGNGWVQRCTLVTLDPLVHHFPTAELRFFVGPISVTAGLAHFGC